MTSDSLSPVLGGEGWGEGPGDKEPRRRKGAKAATKRQLLSCPLRVRLRAFASSRFPPWPALLPRRRLALRLAERELVRLRVVEDEFLPAEGPFDDERLAITG